MLNTEHPPVPKWSLYCGSNVAFNFTGIMKNYIKRQQQQREKEKNKLQVKRNRGG